MELRIRKKRYFCKPCKKPFTELLQGVFSRARHTDRLAKHILWLGKKFRTLKAAAQAVGLALTTVQRIFYAMLAREKVKVLNYPWPKTIGIDETGFGKNKNGRGTQYDTVITDMTHGRVYELLFTKSSRILFDQLKDMPGAENVQDVVMDMSTGFRSLARALFPNAKITSDKFHVLRLMLPAINKQRNSIYGRKYTHPSGQLLLRSRQDLSFIERSRLENYIAPHEVLTKLYWAKEKLHELYRVRGYERARLAFERLIADLEKNSHLVELRRLKKTLLNWKEEILNYFRTGLTNAMAEGFNNKINTLKTNAYGYRNKNNFGLRVLSDCI
jgi:transposase